MPAFPKTFQQWERPNLLGDTTPWSRDIKSIERESTSISSLQEQDPFPVREANTKYKFSIWGDKNEDTARCSLELDSFHERADKWEMALLTIATIVKSLIKHKELESKFQKLASKWREEIRFESSLSKMVTHPAYLSIIGMGPNALPLILRDLEETSDHWFVALRAITDESPVKPKDAGNVKKMKDAWLEWGRRKRLVN